MSFNRIIRPSINRYILSKAGRFQYHHLTFVRTSKNLQLSSKCKLREICINTDKEVKQNENKNVIISTESKVKSILFDKLPKSKKVVYLDLEYLNQTLGSPIRPEAHHWKEVVQIGALEFDNENGCETRKLDIMINPIIHSSELTADQWVFFTKLTGLTQHAT